MEERKGEMGGESRLSVMSKSRRQCGQRTLAFYGSTVQNSPPSGLLVYQSGLVQAEWLLSTAPDFVRPPGTVVPDGLLFYP